MENLEYDKLKFEYFKLFDKLPPYYVGINREHPIYLNLLKESIESGKEMDLGVFQKEVEKQRQLEEEESQANKLFGL